MSPVGLSVVVGVVAVVGLRGGPWVALELWTALLIGWLIGLVEVDDQVRPVVLCW